MAQSTAHSPQDTLHQSVVCSMDIVPGSARMLWLQGLEVEVILRTFDYFVQCVFCTNLAPHDRFWMYASFL